METTLFVPLMKDSDNFSEEILNFLFPKLMVSKLNVAFVTLKLKKYFNLS